MKWPFLRHHTSTCFSLIGWLTIAGCTPASPWHYHSLPTYAREERSERLSFMDPNRLGGLDLEVLYSPQGTCAYITCLGGARAHEKSLALLIKDITYHYSVRCMEGGERFLLPQEATQQILLALQETEPFTLQMEYHIATLDPKTCTYYIRRLHSNKVN